MAGLARGDVPVEMRDHALRQVVGLDLVADREALQLGHEPPMAADHAPDEPRLRKMVEAAVLAVSLAGGIDQGEVARLADVSEQLLLGGKAELLERDRDLLGEADAVKPPVAIVSPLRIRRTASRAETTLPLSRACTTGATSRSLIGPLPSDSA